MKKLQKKLCFLCEKEVSEQEVNDYCDPKGDEDDTYWHLDCGLKQDLTEANQIYQCPLCEKDVGYMEYPNELHNNLFCLDCKKHQKRWTKSIKVVPPI